jgi:hypothetical protein
MAGQASLRSLPKVGCEPGHDDKKLAGPLLENVGLGGYHGAKPQ